MYRLRNLCRKVSEKDYFITRNNPMQGFFDHGSRRDFDNDVFSVLAAAVFLAALFPKRLPGKADPCASAGPIRLPPCLRSKPGDWPYYEASAGALPTPWLRKRVNYPHPRPASVRNPHTFREYSCAPTGHHGSSAFQRQGAPGPSPPADPRTPACHALVFGFNPAGRNGRKSCRSK